jgi:hypothetical protein
MSGTTSVAIKDENGKVVLQFPEAVKWCELDPEMARQAAEAMARAAYRCKYRVDPPDNRSALAGEMRQRVTNQIRNELIARMALILKSLQDKGRAPHHMAAEVVDQLLARVA